MCLCSCDEGEDLRLLEEAFTPLSTVFNTIQDVETGHGRKACSNHKVKQGYKTPPYMTDTPHEGPL
ncbi:hypothetical protein E2C01_042519 [Portunus trituberculatus]|uniref:Uncharacterized protein n=1 Tax=Portunus trituberculatus TaxID=210409 RepID=A0A5B7FT93_PORTR|nr:hypothetical protein [Portunus trituberculatus]